MRIDRYVHDERLTWGAASLLLVVTVLHAAGIGRLLLTRPEAAYEAPPPPIFQVSMLRLPPPRLPPEMQQTPDTTSDAIKQERPRVTRPVPILVDTPTTDPVPPDTQVKQYEMGDELRPGEPGPAMPEGAVVGNSSAAAEAQQTPVFWKMKLLEMKRPNYPPRCLRLGIEGTVRLRVLVGEDGRPQDATIGTSSGDAGLDQVAGPVGEALIMTALGLAVAVPAVIGYNLLVRNNRVIIASFHAFAEDLLAYLTTGARVPSSMDHHRAHRLQQHAVA